MMSSFQENYLNQSYNQVLLFQVLWLILIQTLLLLRYFPLIFHTDLR